MNSCRWRGSSFDHLVGEGTHQRWNFEVYSLEIDHEFEFGRLEDWQIRWFLAVKNATGITPHFAEVVQKAQLLSAMPPRRRAQR
jgi:hypothetical protein